MVISSNAAPRDYEGSTAIIFDIKRGAGDGFICFAVAPLHPELKEVWCRADLMKDARCMVVLRNPSCSGYLPSVVSVIQPINSILAAQALWMRDFYKACIEGEKNKNFTSGPGHFIMPKDYLDGFIPLSQFLDDEDYLEEAD